MTGGSGSLARTRRGSRAKAADAKAPDDDRKAPSSLQLADTGGGVFKSAAVAILRRERRLLTTGEITKLAMDLGLLKCQGKTPDATMASALYTDVKRKLNKSVFTRPQEGLFGLRQWIEEGFYPEGWVGPQDGLGLAPFKRRTTGGQRPARGTPKRVPRGGHGGRHLSRELTGEDEAGGTPTTTSAADGDDEEVERTEEETPEGEHTHGDTQTNTEDASEDTEQVSRPSAAQRPFRSARLGAAAAAAVAAAAEAEEMCIKQEQEALLPQTSHPHTHSAPAPQPQSSMPQDECLSPLHVLSDAALMGKDEEDERPDPDELQHPPRATSMQPPKQGAASKRKRPTSVNVPERGMLGSSMLSTSGRSGEGLTPRSPFEDSLAALHEIATSPSTYAVQAAADDKRRPQLQVDVSGRVPDGPPTSLGSALPGIGTPLSLLLGQGLDTPGLQQLLSSTTPGMFLNISPLMTGPSHAGMCKASTNSPHSMSMLTAAMNGGSSLLLPLPDQLPTPHELERLKALSKAAQEMRAQGAGSAGPSSQATQTSSSGASGQPGTSGPGQQQHQQQQHGLHIMQLHGVSGGMSGRRQQHQRQYQQQYQQQQQQQQQRSGHDLGEVQRLHGVAERLESRLGSSHPQVGKAWLACARMYQNANDATHDPHVAQQALAALQRAQHVLRTCSESCGSVVQCDGAFSYLIQRAHGAANATEAS